jgi:hypothetical protein
MTGRDDDRSDEDQDSDAPQTAPGGPAGVGIEDRSQEAPLGSEETAGGSGSEQG